MKKFAQDMVLIGKITQLSDTIYSLEKIRAKLKKKYNRGKTEEQKFKI